jgi:hypothetical protein
MKHLIWLGLILAVTTSCKKKVDYGLTLTVSPSESYALNSAVFSCAQIAGIDGKTTDTPSVTPYRVLLGKPVITWTNTAKFLAIDQIVIIFQNSNLSGGKYVFTGIDMTELRGIIQGTGGALSGWDSVRNYVQPATSAGPTVLNSGCELRIGGLPITDTTPSIRVQGTIKIFGRAVGLDGANNVTSEDPIYTETPIYFKYIKF